MDKAWTMIEKAKEKEDKARKMIQDLKTEISNLNKIVEKGSGLSIGPDSTVHELMRNKEDLQKCTYSLYSFHPSSSKQGKR